MRKSILFLTLLLSSLLMTTSVVATPDVALNLDHQVYLPLIAKPWPPDPQRDALMALYNSTNGPNWVNNRGWGTGDPCDPAWHGVRCDSGHVQVLYLTGNQLSGPIPAELGNLSSLEQLSLDSNQLSGPIPAELSNLSSLWYLFLNDNPALVCWQTQEALNWALGLAVYVGPDAVCP
jgi:Leucine-rich repeat (LRR) protein